MALSKVRRSLREIWRRRREMMMPVMRMERISRFDNATPEVLKNPFQNI
jgi:hypothetical protein